MNQKLGGQLLSRKGGKRKSKMGIGKIIPNEL
jgi:hypothetical protein